MFIENILLDCFYSIAHPSPPCCSHNRAEKEDKNTILLYIILVFSHLYPPLFSYLIFPKTSEIVRGAEKVVFLFIVFLKDTAKLHIPRKISKKVMNYYCKKSSSRHSNTVTQFVLRTHIQPLLTLSPPLNEDTRIPLIETRVSSFHFSSDGELHHCFYGVTTVQPSGLLLVLSHIVLPWTSAFITWMVPVEVVFFSQYINGTVASNPAVASMVTDEILLQPLNIEA